MKKLIALGIAAAFLGGICANAITVNVSEIPGYHAGSGGEFNVNPVIGTGYSPLVVVSGGFETFCFDRNPGLTIPGTYNASVNTSGIDAFGLHMNVGQAWLYQQFAKGTLAGYDYINTAGGSSSGRALSALDLQLAIWNLGGQYGPPIIGAGMLANIFVNAAVAHFGSVAGALAFTTGSEFGVGILDLSTIGTSSVNVQPVFTLLPDGGSAVILLGMGLSGLALIARKIRG